MSFDTCYIVYAGQRPPISELVNFWEQHDYELQNPNTKKIHIINSDGDDVLVDELPVYTDDENLLFSLWHSQDDSLLVTLTKRGDFYSEEYGFMGTSGEMYMVLMNKLNQRFMNLTRSGLLLGVFFDRRDYILESIPNW